MGSGRWDANAYAMTTDASLRSVGVDATFAHSTHTMSSLPRSEWKAHETLDPEKAIAGAGSPLEGQRVRESRDIDGKVSTPVAVIFDVTGSMSQTPKELVKRLPTLFGLLQMKGYVSDPQVMFGAIGDATCDAVPLQIGQFEADNRADETLTNLVLEGGGGGQMTESYELAAYFMSRRTATDAWEKREHKGHLFLMGDELAYGQVKAAEVRKVIGDELDENIGTEAIFRELQEKWIVTFIIPGGTSHFGDERLLEYWQGLLGAQNVIKLPDLSAVAETIAVRVGLAEDAVTLEQGLKDLADENTDEATIDAVSSALTTA